MESATRTSGWNSTVYGDVRLETPPTPACNGNSASGAPPARTASTLGSMPGASAATRRRLEPDPPRLHPGARREHRVPLRPQP